MGSGASVTIVWFRRDLRIEDNPALAAAAKEGNVFPLFVWCPREESQFYPGRVSRWWLKQSLSHLDQSLKSLGCGLTVMKSENTFSALLKCIEATGATRVVYNNLYDPVSLVRDHKIKQQLIEHGISVICFNGDLLYEPWEVYDENGNTFTTFDSYWNKCLTLSIEPATLLPPWRLASPSGSVEGCTIEELGLEDELEKSSNALLSRAWSPGWSNADKALNEFVSESLLDYSKNRQKVVGATTSLLSPYLHFGELSIRKVYQCIRMKQISCAREGNSKAEESVNLFLRSIGLREYSRYICFNFPFTHEKSLLGNLRNYPWRSDESHFKAWRQGRTGYPLVDAGMRELWATGWIHNRTRVIVSSFFVKVLLLPWTWGMKYFWDTLLDADLESDILGWQYISGSLPDGHELDRLDSPEVQGNKFDPEGEYVRQWLPELARLPTEWIHHPWDAPNFVLQASGVELGLNYPRPIIDLESARERLSDAIAVMREMDNAMKVNEANEVIAENSNMTPVIPRVSVRKAVSCSSSYDQRVPSMRNSMDISHGKKEMDRGRLQQENLSIPNYKAQTIKTDEDLCSTAESSSARKRSVSGRLSSAPPPCSSSSCGPPNGYIPKNIEVGSPSMQPGKEQYDGAIFQKHETDSDDEVSINYMRPCKRST